MEVLPLEQQWQLRCVSNQAKEHFDPATRLHCTMPSEVHQTLLEQGFIPDPYEGLNEQAIQWVANQHWCYETQFELTQEQCALPGLFLRLREIDTLAEVFVNDEKVQGCSNFFCEYVINLKSAAKPGINTLAIQLSPAAEEALHRAEALPFPVPYNEINNRIPHLNTLRKTQCHGGWDWGICLMATGIYQTPEILCCEDARIDYVRVEQIHELNQVTLNITVDLELFTTDELSIGISLNGKTVHFESAELGTGNQTLTRVCVVENPKLWWPAGYGEQPLYDLNIGVGNASHQQRLGLRKLEVVTEADDIGTGLVIRVNDVDIFCKGANWIPADALPLQTTEDRYRKLLTDARDANMNCLRVWGGGMFERETFYDLCDELGLLLWHDFMFACSLYPSTDEFIADVEQELFHQLKRLQHRASIALWCGDNEVIGAINWYEISRTNREKYVVNYDRLNRNLASASAQLDSTRRFWPSSPCNGELDFGDAWHDDHSGDMHFWDVWHSGKSFDAFYDVKPRFCSEFGYQSLPSMNTVASFATEDQWNLTSPVMEGHQKNPQGNSIITEMFTRYFRFPEGFTNTLYLSQVQQAVAVKTAVEYWRSLRPQCMGILYWQLNDNWPVASWSSLEHNGQWKQLHYHAKRFYQPLLFTFSPTDDRSAWELRAINDQLMDESFSGTLRQVLLDGTVLKEWQLEHLLPAESSQVLASLTKSEIDQRAAESFFVVQSHEGIVLNSFYFAPWKHMDLPKPTIRHSWQASEADDNALTVVLETDVPAHFVTLSCPSGAMGHWSDNSVTLLPGYPVTLNWQGDDLVDIESFVDSITIQHLRSTYS